MAILNFKEISSKFKKIHDKCYASHYLWAGEYKSETYHEYPSIFTLAVALSGRHVGGRILDRVDRHHGGGRRQAQLV